MGSCVKVFSSKYLLNSLSSSSSQAQIDAISTLMYHIGVSIDMNYIKDKTKTMPLASDRLPPAEPIDLPTDKKIIVFNHRWGKTTGVNRLLEYFEGLEDERNDKLKELGL